MEALLAEWGTEILFGLISAAVIGWAKWKNSQIMRAKEAAEKNAATLAEQKLDAKIENKIDIELEPVFQELEDLRM